MQMWNSRISRVDRIYVCEKNTFLKDQRRIINMENISILAESKKGKEKKKVETSLNISVITINVYE